MYIEYSIIKNVCFKLHFLNVFKDYMPQKWTFFLAHQGFFSTKGTIYVMLFFLLKVVFK
jgi:hypothetical protein